MYTSSNVCRYLMFTNALMDTLVVDTVGIQAMYTSNNVCRYLMFTNALLDTINTNTGVQIQIFMQSPQILLPVLVQ